LTEKTGGALADVKKVIIWGNHSATQYPDLHHATVRGKPALSLVDESWFKDSFIPTVQQRGATVIKARGTSSAASAASAALDHIHDWMLGTPAGDWVSMGIPSDGSYGIPEGVIYSYPVTCRGGEYSIVQGLRINDFSREKMSATHRELLEERDGVKDLI
jgi:malate dehydrogenase